MFGSEITLGQNSTLKRKRAYSTYEKKTYNHRKPGRPGWVLEEEKKKVKPERQGGIPESKRSGSFGPKNPVSGRGLPMQLRGPP